MSNNIEVLRIESEIHSLKQSKQVLVDQLIEDLNAIDEQIQELREELKSVKHGKRKAGNGGRLRDDSL